MNLHEQHFLRHGRHRDDDPIRPILLAPLLSVGLEVPQDLHTWLDALLAAARATHSAE